MVQVQMIACLLTYELPMEVSRNRVQLLLYVLFKSVLYDKTMSIVGKTGESHLSIGGHPSICGRGIPRAGGGGESGHKKVSWHVPMTTRTEMGSFILSN